MSDDTTADVLYNIPAYMAADRNDLLIVVRSSDPAEIADVLSRVDLERISNVQLTSLDANVEKVAGWPAPAPIDLVMHDPQAEYPLLYEWSPLLADHQMRVTVPLVPGFGKAVSLATSLEISVKLEIAAPPTPPALDELNKALYHYLHNQNVTTPVEFFHSVLLAHYNKARASMWDIQEEDPASFRYVTDDGVETISPRFEGAALEGEIETFPARFKARMVDEGAECRDCECLEICNAYFKWPDRDYACTGIRETFRLLREAAEELRKDAAAFESDGESEH